MLRQICYLIISISIAVTSPVRAEIIRGRIIDADTREALENVDLLCTGAYKKGNKNYNYSTHLLTDSLGRFLFFSNTSGKITAKLIGYYPKEVQYIAISDAERDTVDMGDIALKMSEVMMKTLEVKGRARRFTMSGDTVVFHPEAFHLEKGARLEELIVQLPGVEYDGNSLKWNGKPIRVVMNGESLFGKSDLYKQLPAEAIETIKAYNKASEFSERTGRDDGGEDMVLDLKVKKSFLDKFYGNASAAYYTPKNYDVAADVHRLSENHPMMISASFNNINMRHHRTMNSASSERGKTFGQGQYGAVGYQHNWKRKDAGQTLKSNWSVSGGLGHYDTWERGRTDTENFFAGEDYNYITDSKYSRTHTLKHDAVVTYRQAINKKNTISAHASYDYNRSRQKKDKRSAQFDRVPDNIRIHSAAIYFDSLSVPGMLLRSRIRQTAEGDAAQLSAGVGWTHYIKDGSLSVSAHVNYTEQTEDGLTERFIEHLSGDNLSTTFLQSSHSPTHGLNAQLTAKANRWVGKKVLLDFSYRFGNLYRHSERDMMEDDILDSGNSYDEQHTRRYHHLDLSSTVDLGRVQLKPVVSMEVLRERMDYSRGSLDTVAIRHFLVCQPKLHVKWKMTKESALELDYNLKTTLPDIIETLDYRDDSDPMYIREGNPGLRKMHVNSLSIKYNSVNSRRQRMLNLAADFSCRDRVMQYVQIYDPQTMVYTSRPEMVRGDIQGGLSLGYDKGLGNEFRLKNTLGVRYARYYGCMTRTDISEPARLNRKNSFSPSESITLSYDHVWVRCSLFGSVGMNRLRYSEEPRQNTTLWNGRVGLAITFIWKDLTVGTDITENIRRGYIIESMNNDYLIWNASATWKTLGNKAQLRLKFYDILNKIDYYYARQSANQNVYYWNEERHHIASISFIYYFDAKNKKK